MSNPRKFGEKCVKLAGKTGVLKFKKKRGVETLDLPVKDAEVLKYFLETSNWFLFEKDDEMLNLMDMYLR